MKQKEMLETLSKKATLLRDDLIKMEKEFNAKKEEFLRVQGAIEALSELEE